LFLRGNWYANHSNSLELKDDDDDYRFSSTYRDRDQWLFGAFGTISRFSVQTTLRTKNSKFVL
jgi:hypothetical protein